MSGRTPDLTAEVAARAGAGDREALRELVEYAYPLVRRWTLVLLGDPHDAEDLTQDVLVQMIRKLDSFHAEARFSTWLYSVTRNAVTDEVRRRGRRRRIAEDESVFDAVLPAPAADPARAAERTELADLLRTFFRALPDRQREVFELVELQGISSQEAAEILGIAPASVRVSLLKARRAIRERILAERPEMAPEAT